MRQGPPPNGRRPRGRHHGDGGNRHGGGGNPNNMRGGGGGGNMDNRPRSAASLRHQSFDSNCIDVRVRGNAWQVHEKYQALARDAQSAGDRVAAENYLQHAEHYFRIIEAINEATAIEQRQSGRPNEPTQGFGGGQPEMPTNYYGAANVPPVTVAGAQSADPNNASAVVTPNPYAQPQQQQQAQGNGQVSNEAEVQHRQPQQPSPFFTAEEIEPVGDGQQPLVARR